jgi:hypothetical protein
MAAISPEFYARWRSKKHVGPAAPTLRVTLTRGIIDKTYQEFEFLGGGNEQFMTIVGGNNTNPWQGFWRPTGDPIDLPNVLSVNISQSLQEKGARSAVIEAENIIYAMTAGPGGIFHRIERGFLSPTLGSKLLRRIVPALAVKNEWNEVLNNGYKIDVYEGYGDQQVRTFCGLIDTTELQTQPDRITLNCRSFFMLFTDQRVMGANKAPEIVAPLTVADRERTLGVKPVGHAGSASSTAAGRSVTDITKKENATDWVSRGRPTAEGVEWVQMEIPPGYYENLYLRLPYKGQGVYISIFAIAGSVWNGNLIEKDEWIDAGKGTVGGLPYTNGWGSSSVGASRRSLGAPFQAAKGTKVRISFTNLPYRSEWGDHRAGCTRLAAFLFGTDAKHPLNGDPGQNAKHWVLIDDLADIAKMVFMWAGYHEWDVEELGWSLDFPMSWTMDKFLVDILDDILAQANWVLYEESPSPSSESLGVPVFEHNAATDAPSRAGMLEITDADVLETIQPKFDLSNLPWVIYYRGNVDSNGKSFDEELIRRYRAIYFPPWSGAGPEISEEGRVGGVRRHDVTVDENLTSQDQCMLAARLAAYQYALEAFTVQFQIPGYPGIELNQQVSVVSNVTGINSRVWVSEFHTEHTTGKKASWTMTVGGSLLDTEDMDKITEELLSQRLIVAAEKVLKEGVGLVG